jgi:cold shock CspA family protein
MSSPDHGGEKSASKTFEALKTGGSYYLRRDLDNATKRDLIAKELQNRKWAMIIDDTKSWQKKGFCFLKHDQFPDNVFLHISQVPPGVALLKGCLVEVTVSIGENPKYDRCDYKAKVIRLKESPLDTPVSHPVQQPMQTGKKNKKSRRAKKTASKISALSRSAGLKQLKNLRLAVPSASNFGVNDDFITVYIDETWPEADTASRKKKGIIGGIVWRGYQPDYKALPHIKTHVRTSATGINALNCLLSCDGALPFVMPIEGHTDVTQSDYFELIASAVKVVLGWLLPQEGVKSKVRILMEHIGSFEVDTDRTDYFKGMLKEARPMNPNRFSRWNLEVVKWCDKEEEYIP